MELKDLLKLQNGSDVRGVACEGVAGEPVTLTDEAAQRIGLSFALWLAEKVEKQPAELVIGVGCDSRITGPQIRKAFIRGLNQAGVLVYDCGMASTPAMFMSLVYPETGFDGSCMITASHLPFNRNGIKFFDRNGGLEKTDIKELLTTAAALTVTEDVKENRKTMDLMDLYSRNLRETIRDAVAASDRDHPLKGLHIVVDAGNGAGGFFVSKVLNPLGADTSGSQYLEPDGMFPNHQPNPENKEAMAAIRQATVENHADLGLIFDTDVDRMSAVLANGTPINRDSIIAMMAAILQPEYPGSTIITDSVTSDRLTDFLEGKLGLKHLRYKRGYKNVIDKCKELNASGEISPLAMETSGHGCLKDNYYLDDGAFLAVKLLIAVAREKSAGRTIDHLIADLSTEYKDREVRFQILRKDFAACGQEELDRFREKAEQAGFLLPVSYEGVRVKFTGTATGWLVFRASLHDPVMVLNMEGKTQQDLETITEVVRDFLKDETGIDISSL